ncbi:hypothetical protein HY468_04345 [Candidatus Roizmanbacteria bacterium]|nr:hypothetical protein [Candidatus Roizmanbacteria bacterium]
MKKIILTGLLVGTGMLVLSFVVSPLLTLVFPAIVSEYQNPSLFRPWTDPLMMLYFLHPFTTGIILSWIWEKTKGMFKQKEWWRRGAAFGLTYGLISLPGMLISYATFPLSVAMVVSWTVSALVQLIGAGIVLVKIRK